MNKNDLVATVSNAAGLSKADATKAVDCVFKAITDSLKGGVEVRLVGFGPVGRCAERFRGRSGNFARAALSSLHG